MFLYDILKIIKVIIIITTNNVVVSVAVVVNNKISNTYTLLSK